MFTEEQIKEYLDKDASVCPYCGSNNIENGVTKYEYMIYQEIWCRNCDMCWWETYQLVGIEEA